MSRGGNDTFVLDCVSLWCVVLAKCANQELAVSQGKKRIALPFSRCI